MRLALTTLTLTLLSCASASQLAKRSESARLRGDPERAYTLALEARAKDANAPATRAAVDEAAWALYEQSRRRVQERAAAGDTFEAADRLIDLDRLRLRFAQDGVALAHDESFVAQERALRDGGAAFFYSLGTESLRGRRPKDAWYEFRTVRDLIPGYRDVDRQIERAWDRAVTHVAVLPFNDQAGLPDESRTLARGIHAQLASRLDARFTFTRLIDPNTIEERLPVARLGQLDREQAVELGHALGAQRIVWGRIWNLRSDTNTDRWSDAIWRQVPEKDSTGHERSGWVQVPFRAVSRLRTVHVEVEYEVIDVGTGEALEHREEPREIAAHTAYTSTQVDGDCEAYRLAPATLDDDARDRIQDRWKNAFAPWTLPELLDQSRLHAGRSSYRRDCCPEFRRSGRVFLDDLPPPEDLAVVALEDLWQPVLESLARLDPR